MIVEIYHFKIYDTMKEIKKRIEYLENKMKRKDSYIDKMIEVNNELKRENKIKDNKIRDIDTLINSMVFSYNKKVKECDDLESNLKEYSDLQIKLQNELHYKNNDLQHKLDECKKKIRSDDGYLNQIFNQYKAKVDYSKLRDAINNTNILIGLNKIGNEIKSKEPLIDNVTIENLGAGLRLMGYDLGSELIDKIIDLVELIEQKGDNTTMKDVFEIKSKF